MINLHTTLWLLQEFVRINAVTLDQNRALPNTYREPDEDERMTPQNPEETSTWANL